MPFLIATTTRRTSSKPASSILTAFLVLGLLATSIRPASAASATWNGSAGTPDLATGTNWSTGTVPSVTGDTAIWDGTIGGDLSLTLSSSAFAGSPGNTGLGLSVAATQTSALAINATAASTMRISGLTVEAGAGPLSFGTSGNTLSFTLGGANGQTHTFTNNSSNAVTFGANVAWGLGGGGYHSIYFTGTGDYTFDSVLNISSEPTLYFTGSGTVTLNGANANFNQGTYIGQNQSTGIVRVAATQALGGNLIRIGDGGNASTARLELIGDISMNNPITANFRNNDSTSILNVSGHNTLSGTISANVGGSQFYIQSDGGLLTLAGATALTSAAGARTFTLRGSGDGEITGAITNGAATVSLVKDGTGTWTLSGANTYTGNTTVGDGMLMLTSTGQLTFSIGASGANTQILGTGRISLDGTFVFDLTGAGTNPGDNWQVVDLSAFQSASFGANFNVSGFQTSDGLIWTSADGTYQFDQATGMLTAVPEPSTIALLAGALAMAFFASRRCRSA
jgi:autotransporter-associated beta strand protein